MKAREVFTKEELKQIDLLLDDAFLRAKEMLYHPEKVMPYYEDLVDRLRKHLGIEEAEE